MRAQPIAGTTDFMWFLGMACPGLAHHSPTNYDQGQVMEIEGERTRKNCMNSPTGCPQLSRNCTCG